jgi:AraC family transcriptional regulator of arabinose operon
MEERLLFIGSSHGPPHLPLALDGLGIGHNQEHICRPTGIPFYQWVQCVSGKGVLILNDNTYLVEEGCGIFLPAHVPHEYKGLTDHWMVNFLCFNGVLVPQILNTLGLEEGGVYQLSHPQHILDLEQKIYELYQSTDKAMIYESSKLLYALLIDLTRDITKTQNGQSLLPNEKIQSAINYINAHYMELFTLLEVADHVQLTREYLSQLFHHTMGCTIMDFTLDLRMAQAKIALIKYPEKKIKEIASMTGFQDSSYFCAVFKKFEHLTPKSFRESRK